MASRVLVPIDDSPQSVAALEHVMAEFPDADVTLLHVIDPLETWYSTDAVFPSSGEHWYESERKAAQNRFDEVQSIVGTGKVDTVIEVGRPARVIVEYAANHPIDLIVMGSHGRSGIARFLLGSVTEVVVRRSPVPVTVIR